MNLISAFLIAFVILFVFIGLLIFFWQILGLGIVFSGIITIIMEITIFIIVLKWVENDLRK